MTEETINPATVEDQKAADGQESAKTETESRDPVDEKMVEAILGAEEFLPIDLECAEYNLNDVGNARRLIKRYGDKLMFVRDIGWHAWVGTHWSQERGAIEARKLAHATHKAIYKEAAAMMKMEGKVNKRIKGHFKWASGAGNTNRVNNMLNEAATYLTVNVDDLDKNKWLFNVANGTLDLRDDCRLLPHNQADRITKVSPVKFDPDAGCDTFYNFLNRIMPSENLRVFLQSWFGYSMTGVTAEQCLVFFLGNGANGKSTLVDIAAHIFGDYTKTIPFESFAYNDRKRGADASPDIARLPGSRFVRTTEPEAGMRLSESIVKSLTGSDRIVARHLNMGFFEYVPEFKLTLFGNYKPEIRGQDEGIWRRICLVKFEQHIPPEERDPELGEKLIAEASGVLNWMLDGFRTWKEKKLVRPKEVLESTDEYRDESDPIGNFMDAMTRISPGSSIQAKFLYDEYARWCQENGMKAFSQTAFGRGVIRRPGITKEKSGLVRYLGIEMIQ